MAETEDITEPVLVAITALPGCMAWRAQAGTFKTIDGRRFVKIGPDGIADIMGTYYGRSIAIETKTKTGTLRVSQKRFRNAWVAHGGIYIVARSPEEAVNALSQF